MTFNKRKAQRMLRDMGFTLKRTTGHEVWKHSDGRMISLSTNGHDHQDMRVMRKLIEKGTNKR